MYFKNIPAHTDGISLEKIADFCECKLIGNSSDKAFGFSSIDAPTENTLTFSKSKTINKLDKSCHDKKVAGIFVKNDIKLEDKYNCSLLLCEDPQKTLIKATELFFEKTNSDGVISSKATISESAIIGNNVSIGDNVVIYDNVTIGDDTIIFPNSIVYPHVKIGNNCVIHSSVSIREYSKIGNKVTIYNGSVIGSDGFGYIETSAGLAQVPQIGDVVIEDLVDIGANSCIDRAALGSTHIGLGTKIDNQVQIGHNTQVGQFSILCGQVGIAGSTKIGNGVVLGGSVKVKDHIEIVDGCRVAGGSTVLQSLRKKTDYAGTPAIEASKWIRQLRMLKRGAK